MGSLEDYKLSNPNYHENVLNPTRLFKNILSKKPFKSMITTYNISN